ncbi:hypothetical protein [Microbacterium sp. GCS4]|uniref:hypothetical protein n=1 Tax=Microbacterium sp. GCS4 TaxID=1692239 RepID=UPI0006835381|nr:hypothetical protein [Microbacterium sp. GCS4]KNY07910.1 hypothetical protein AKH00_06745 [Microbacterium sp. GCS4]
MSTPKPLAMVALLALGVLVTGCSQPTAMDKAWDNCLRITAKSFTDGDVEAARADCQEMKDATSQAEFIDMYGDLYE